jgi:hypothetical protein
VAWQTAQSLSVWQLTHAVMFRCASKAWCRPVRGKSVHSDLGGWKRPRLATLPKGEVSATPARWWQEIQKDCARWQLPQLGSFCRAAMACIPSQSFGCTWRGRTRPSWHSVHSRSAWHVEQNSEFAPAAVR